MEIVSAYGEEKMRRLHIGANNKDERKESSFDYGMYVKGLGLESAQILRCLGSETNVLSQKF